MSKSQTDRRRAAKAESVWEARQVAAAAAWKALHEASEVLLTFSDELSDEDLATVRAQLAARRQEVRDFLMKHRDLYVDRMSTLGMVPTPMVGRSPEEEADWSRVMSS